MRYEVIYLKPKKNTYAKHTATFLDLEGAIFWQSVIEKQGAKDIIITPR
jgi:hypothetical protein